MAFNDFHVNIGNIFNLSTGTFTAPVKGIYEFSFSGNGAANSEYGIHVHKNGGRIHGFYTRSPEKEERATYDNLASTWLVTLDVNDTVKLKRSYGGFFTNYNMNRVFNGKLLASL